MQPFYHKDIEGIRIAVNPVYPMLTVNIYFIDGLLVDTGPSKRRSRLIPIFNNWDIREVAITHHHEDHSGMASWIARHFSADIYVHESAREKAHHTARMPWYRELFTGRRLPFRTQPYSTLIQTPNHRFYPISSPGHTPDHVCLYEPDFGWLFTGDLYITPHPKVFTKEESITAYIETLRKLSRLDFDTMFCGHEGVIADGKAKLDEKRAYLEEVRGEVIRMHQAGDDDQTIRKKLFPGKVRLERMSLGTFSRLNLVRSCLRDV